MENQKCKNICKNACDYLKQNCIIIIVSSLIIVFVLLVYFIFIYSKSKENSSYNISDFNNFIIPILTVINIFVFIRLTNKIDENNKKKHKKEIEMQIKFQIFNIRNERIKELNDAFILMRNELKFDDSNRKATVNQLYNVRRIIMTNFSKSILFENDSIQRYLDDKSTFYKYTETYSKNKLTLEQCDSIKDTLFDESFSIIKALEIFSIQQLKSSNIDTTFSSIEKYKIENTKLNEVINLK